MAGMQGDDGIAMYGRNDMRGILAYIWSIKINYYLPAVVC